MFERFTKAARDTVIGAQQQAATLGQHTIGTEHTLLALVAGEDPTIRAALHSAAGEVDEQFVRAAIIRHLGGDTPAQSIADRDAEDAEVLKSIGIDLEAVRAAIEENFGAGALRLPRPAPKKKGIFGRLSAGYQHRPFSARNKKVLELSLREALRLKHNYIAPEHIMLGILREGQGLAMLILTERGVDFDVARDRLTRALNTPAA
ncbi:Clp protease N-terminal domain-containing protein [Actinoplanes derwentensis]|uniref:Clp amino terminal domain-containing protein, pathogenicity island component n=1 Tax=Actinoplanes derwentensis TaxID=113562 RepID=A0A1H2D9T2_9ACTN|nr:Clp protease N-terminal domain-containing protein [Actinoplanes derwentensis]GID81576.1 Clp protease [Actinoplanes derwentensis]SDT79349.1 Clp amino terminal domain-containing protein, pathogenicity island component [Actinoplanes derwentensis]